MKGVRHGAEVKSQSCGNVKICVIETYEEEMAHALFKGNAKWLFNLGL